MHSAASDPPEQPDRTDRRGDTITSSVLSDLSLHVNDLLP
jgi:hypothetical protein